MWSDNDTAEDLIGFRVHAELIRDVVQDNAVLPLTIGVFGDWGSGKTSIMKMLQAELAKNEDIAVLYFDAWLFEGYDDAKSALISSILKQLMEHKHFPAALKDKALKLIKRVNWMRLMKMGWDDVALPAVLAYATGGATAVPAVITVTCLGSSDHSKLESCRSDLVLVGHVLRSEFGGCQIAQARVRSDVVVVLPPRLDDRRRLPSGTKPLHAQTLFA
jgi:hypothetical protein